MADETTSPIPDPVSGLPSISFGRPVTSEEVTDALDEEAGEDCAHTIAEAVSADEPTQASVVVNHRTLDSLGDEW